MAYWNAAGVANKIEELEAYIHMHNVDVMMVMETRSNPYQALTGRPNLSNINGFHCYEAMRTTNYRSGGVATLVKSSLNHIALQPICLDQLQCAPISITICSGETLIIAPVYCPPQPRWTEQQFKLLLSKIHNIPNNGSTSNRTGVIICGDWNAKHRWWGNVRMCQRGKALMKAIHGNSNYNILATGGPTHYPYDQRKRPSAIDFAIYTGIDDHRLTTYATMDLNSDHLPIHISLKLLNAKQHHTTLQQQQLQHKQQPLRRITNTKKFQVALDNQILLNTEINSGRDIDDAIDILVRNIHKAAEIAARQNRRGNQQQSFSQRRRHGSSAIYADLDRDRSFIRMLELKRVIKKLHSMIRSQTTLHLYKQCQLSIKRSIRIAKIKYYNNLFMQIDSDDRFKTQKLWKVTNKFKRQPEPNWPLRAPTNTDPDSNNSIEYRWTKSSTEKAEAFATYLEKRFNPIYTNTLEERNIIENNTQPIIHQTQQITPE